MYFCHNKQNYNHIIRLLVFMCTFYLFLEKAWIFTRTRRPLSKALKHRLYRILKDNNISPEYMIPIDQTNCPPHPTHDTSRPD